MTDIFEKVKDQVKIADAVEAFGIKLNSRDKGLCPFHREKTPSFSIDRKNNIFTCFGCGETGDVITFASKMKEVEPLEAAKLLAEIFHIDVDDCTKRTSIKDYLKECIKDADKTDYFQKRGLTKETVKKYCLGYDVKRNAIVLPYSSELRYYQTRSISDKKFYKPTNEEAGAEPLFNRKALWGTSKEPVFIVESPLCALSIMQCGGVSVSLCGVGGANKLVKEVKSKKPNAPLVLCLDNDEPGQKASASLEKELQTAKVPYIVFNVAGSKKDPNELLMSNPEELKAAVVAAKREVRKVYKRGVASIAASDLQTAKIDPPEWLKDEVLKNLFVECYNEFVREIGNTDELLELRDRQRKLLEQERELNALRVNRMIEISDYHTEIVKVREQITECNKQIALHEMRGARKEDLVEIKEFDDSKVEIFLEKAVVLNHTITFTFINGMSISREYTNGHGGNTAGWLDRRLDRLSKEGKQ